MEVARAIDTQEESRCRLYYRSFAALGIRAQQQSAKPINVDAKVLRSAGSDNDLLGGSWLSYGRRSQRLATAPLKQINTSNVSRLGLSWTYVVGAGGSNQEGTPLVWNNTLYGITTWSVVYALDAVHRQATLALGPEVNQSTVTLEDLLRHREPRRSSLQRHDHRAPPSMAALFAPGCNDRASPSGNRASSIAERLHHHDGSAHRGRQSHYRRSPAVTDPRVVSSTLTTP